MRKNRLFLLSIVASLMLVTLLIGGCAGEADLGTDENPLIWVFVPSGEVDTVTSGGEAMADLIFEETGLVVDIFVATDNTAAIEAMCSDLQKPTLAR